MQSDRRGGKAESRSGSAPSRRSSMRIGYSVDVSGSYVDADVDADVDDAVADATDDEDRGTAERGRGSSARLIGGASADSLYHRLNRTLPLYREFHFRDGRDGTGVSAANLAEFVDAIAGAPPAVLLHHSRSGDFSKWLEDLSGNRALARAVRRIEEQLRQPHSVDDLSRRRQELLALLAPLCVAPTETPQRSARRSRPIAAARALPDSSTRLRLSP
jgi:hypothetical protein